MSEVEFQLGEHTYRATKMNVFVQFHLARKLAPLMLPIAEALGEKLDFKSLKDVEPDKVLAFAGPVVDALGRMPDDEANDIIFGCLNVVQRQVGPGWQNLVPTGQRAMMFDDINLQTMLQLVWKVLEVNMAGFFQDVPLSSDAPAKT